MTKKSIPIAVRQSVWNKFIGQEKGIAECFLGCGSVIYQSSFHCGHIISEADGGELTIDNLRPICSRCNTSIGKTNMDDFCNKWGMKPLGNMSSNSSKMSSKTCSKSEPTRKCKATTLKGKPCPYSAKDGGKYCGHHSEFENGKPCKAITLKGKPCSFTAEENSDYCGVHTEKIIPKNSDKHIESLLHSIIFNKCEYILIEDGFKKYCGKYSLNLHKGNLYCDEHYNLVNIPQENPQNASDTPKTEHQENESDKKENTRVCCFSNDEIKQCDNTDILYKYESKYYCEEHYSIVKTKETNNLQENEPKETKEIPSLIDLTDDIEKFNESQEEKL